MLKVLLSELWFEVWIRKGTSTCRWSNSTLFSCSISLCFCRRFIYVNCNMYKNINDKTVYTTFYYRSITSKKSFHYYMFQPYLVIFR
jgi:hypothetical protein